MSAEKVCGRCSSLIPATASSCPWCGQGSPASSVAGFGPAPSSVAMAGIALVLAGSATALVANIILLNWRDFLGFATVLNAVVRNLLVAVAPVVLLSSRRLRQDQRWTGVAAGAAAVLGSIRAITYFISAFEFGFGSGDDLILDLVDLAASVALIAGGVLLLRATFARSSAAGVA